MQVLTVDDGKLLNEPCQNSLVYVSDWISVVHGWEITKMHSQLQARVVAVTGAMRLISESHFTEVLTLTLQEWKTQGGGGGDSSCGAMVRLYSYDKLATF